MFIKFVENRKHHTLKYFCNHGPSKTTYCTNYQKLNILYFFYL